MPFPRSLATPPSLRVFYEVWVRGILLGAQSAKTKSKCLGRIFYCKFSNGCFAYATGTQSGQEHVANVMEVANLASVLLAGQEPSEQTCPSVGSRSALAAAATVSNVASRRNTRRVRPGTGVMAFLASNFIVGGSVRMV